MTAISCSSRRFNQTLKDLMLPKLARVLLMQAYQSSSETQAVM